ncbi:MAG TPA: metallophosphoesterase [Bacteriovoracaceae bacterium]|nr:metallophosphoesterase [Bacteriovoracaceae bacterium]
MQIKFLKYSSLSLLLIFSPILQSNYLSQTNIVLIGDSGKNNQGQMDVSLALQDLCSKEDCNLGILAGDNVYPAGVTSSTDPILETVFDNYYNQLNFPFVVALGNHDYGRYGLNAIRASYQLQHAKKNPAFLLPHYWYVHDTPETVFAVIDTTRLMWKRDVFVQARMVEAAYLKAKAENKWFMVVGHHPYRSNGPHGNAGRYERVPYPYFVSGKHIKRFVDLHVCGKAHFYLAGHDHSLQVIDGNNVGCNTQLIVSGSAASATKLSSRNKVKFESLQLGFFHLSIEPNKVRVRAFNQATEMLYEEYFTKANRDLAASE